MSKLSEPVAKALDKLSTHCKGDNIMIMRIIVGNYSPDQYSLQLFDEIYLLRQAPFNDILSTLVEGLPQAIKTTEQPSAAASVGDRTKIRLAKTDGMLYDTRTGRQVLEFGYNESGEQLNEADADQIMASVNRDAPRGNTDLEGILTEEELNKITNNIGNLELWDPRTTIERLIASHRHLLSANAELSFKNNYLQKENDRLDKAEVILASHNNRMFNSLKSIAESSTEIADALRIQANLTLEAFRI